MFQDTSLCLIKLLSAQIDSCKLWPIYSETPFSAVQLPRIFTFNRSSLTFGGLWSVSFSQQSGIISFEILSVFKYSSILSALYGNESCQLGSRNLVDPLPTALVRETFPKMALVAQNYSPLCKTIYLLPMKYSWVSYDRLRNTSSNTSSHQETVDGSIDFISAVNFLLSQAKRTRHHKYIRNYRKD